MEPSAKPAQDAPVQDTHVKAHHHEELSISVKGLQKNAERTLEVVDYMAQVKQLLLRRKQKAQQEETEQAKLDLKDVAARQMVVAVRRAGVADRKEQMVAQREKTEKEG